MIRAVCMTTPGASAWRRYLQDRIPSIACAVDTTGDSVDTCRAALRLAGADACLLLEDDILLCDGFAAEVDSALAWLGRDAATSFWSPPWGCPPGGRWATILHATLCTYLPAGCAAQAAAWEPPGGLARHRHDLLLAGWLRAAGRRVWLHDPSLVQHRRGPSRSNPRAPHVREATNFRARRIDTAPLA